MFRACFDNLATSHSLECTETLSFVKIGWTVTGDANQCMANVIGALKTVVARDVFELLVDTGELQLSITAENAQNDDDIRTFLTESVDADETHFSISIKKHVSNSQVSVYFIDCLAAYLKGASFFDVLRTLSEMFAEKLNFQVFQEITPFNTESISFSMVDTSFTSTTSTPRSDRLDLFKDNTNSTGVPAGLLPSDFFLINRSDLEELNRFFDETSAILSLAFLANTFELQEQNIFSYKIYGYKAVICNDITPVEVAGSVKILNQIYSWAYEGGSAADKLGLVRNVLSIHLTDAGDLKLDSVVWEAIRSNYQIYLKGNIQSYLEVKNKLSELLFDSVARTSKLADDVLDSLKNNIFIVITFLLTVVVINGLKDSSFAAIFSTPYLLIACFLAVSSFLWMAMIRKDALSRYEGAAEAMKEVLHNNYDKFLMRSEIDASLQPTLVRNQKHLKAQIRKYSIWWSCMILLFVLLFVVGNIWFVQGRAIVGKNSETDLIQPSSEQVPRSWTSTSSVAINEIPSLARCLCGAEGPVASAWL